MGLTKFKIYRPWVAATDPPEAERWMANDIFSPLTTFLYRVAPPIPARRGWGWFETITNGGHSPPYLLPRLHLLKLSAVHNYYFETVENLEKAVM